MLDIAFGVSQQRRGMMIRIYTEKVLSEDWIIFNDAFFNLYTSNEDLTEKDIQYV